MIHNGTIIGTCRAKSSTINLPRVLINDVTFIRDNKKYLVNLDYSLNGITKIYTETLGEYDGE